MGFPRFMLLDVVGVAISVPTSIWLGKVFGESIETLQHKVKELNHILAFAIVAILIVLVWRAWWRKREDGVGPAPKPPDPSPPNP
jgi:membrane protein DedA with SNARE-associated domain